MKTSTILAMAVVVLTACGVSETEIGTEQDTLDTEGAELSATSRTYVTVQRDFRKCAFPMCSGWYVTDVNRVHPTPRYVYALDFKGSGLTEEQIAAAQEGKAVLRGKLGDKFQGFYAFLVTDAWVGLPGVEAGAEFFLVSKVNIQCIKAPCPTMKATKLNAGGSTLFDGLTVKDAALPRVDQNWLSSRVTERGAIVTGAFVKGQLISGSYERILSASQVFVKLPEEIGPCPLAKMPACAAGKVRAYVRDSNRCVLPAACVVPGACAAFLPTCADGYTLQSWSGGQFACPVYACDPTFSVAVEK